MKRESKPNDWQELFEAFGSKLLLFARQQTPDPGEAEDLVQEAFLRFWKLRQTRPDIDPSIGFSFIKQIATDRARQILRRRNREIAATDSIPAAPDLFQKSAENRERAELIEIALRELSREQREVVVLKIWSEFTFEQIGAALQISPNTAASRYRYALERLKRCLITANS